MFHPKGTTWHAGELRPGRGGGGPSQRPAKPGPSFGAAGESRGGRCGPWARAASGRGRRGQKGGTPSQSHTTLKGGTPSQSHTMLCKLGAAFSLCAEKLGLREVKELPERAQPVQVELSAGPPKPKEFSPLHYTALLAREDAGRKTLGPCVRASVCVSVCGGGSG